jgi:hypothetical protein
MRGLFEFESSMKKNWMGGCLALSLAGLSPLAMAQTAEGQWQPSRLEAPLQVLPVAVQDVEHRNPSPLREALRQPYEGTQDSSSKPYRLSPEERHRLREQLRSQPDGAVGRGKP